MEKLHIKNMVCPRCVKTVRSMLVRLNIPYTSIQLGNVQISAPLSDDLKQSLADSLLESGFELLEEKNQKIVNDIKVLVIDLIYAHDGEQEYNYSEIIHKTLLKDYSYLSRIFSSTEGRTIEKYIIEQKIEHVKELLTYGELSISEIAYMLGYSSSAHLSGQFKQVTGMAPSAFRKLTDQSRRPIDYI